MLLRNMQKSCCNYPVEMIDDAFGESDALAAVLRAAAGVDSPRVQIVADMNVVQRTAGLGAKIGRYVQEHGLRLADSPAVIAAGEKIKADGLRSMIRVAASLLDAKLGKEDLVLAIGGGTLLDVACYAAAQIRGGVKVVRMPTTPAAMMDAAFAEYAAVNSSTVKDALRVESRPAAVVIDRTFGATVLDGVWRGGISEAVRLALACDSSLFRKLKELAPAYLAREPEALCEIVEAVVALRKKKGPTQLAEWAALRLESMSSYKLPHGYAIAIGICIDTAYAVETGRMKEADGAAVVGLLESLGALDGLKHSRHLFVQDENLVYGLDAWRLATGSASIVVPAGIGKSTAEREPDRETFKAVLRKLATSMDESAEYAT